MSDQATRERIIEAVRKMRENTVDKGCTPGEAAKFAAKAAEWIEKYQISEAELRIESGDSPEIEVCQNKLRTGKKAFNPGMSQVVNALARGMCCRCIHLHEDDGAVYGIIGDTLDADYVCQVALVVVPALQVMATYEGREHGYEKAGLVRWSNQYLTGAAEEILKRLERDRKERSELKLLEHHLANPNTSTALMVVTGEVIATAKREAVAEVFNQMYPRTRTVNSRIGYDHTARTRGREAGKHVGLHIQLDKPRPSYHDPKHIIGPK